MAALTNRLSSQVLGRPSCTEVGDLPESGLRACLICFQMTFRFQPECPDRSGVPLDWFLVCGNQRNTEHQTHKQISPMIIARFLETMLYVLCLVFARLWAP